MEKDHREDFVGALLCWVGRERERQRATQEREAMKGRQGPLYHHPRECRQSSVTIFLVEILCDTDADMRWEARRLLYGQGWPRECRRQENLDHQYPDEEDIVVYEEDEEEEVAEEQQGLQRRQDEEDVHRAVNVYLEWVGKKEYQGYTYAWLLEYKEYGGEGFPNSPFYGKCELCHIELTV